MANILKEKKNTKTTVNIVNNVKFNIAWDTLIAGTCRTQKALFWLNSLTNFFGNCKFFLGFKIWI